MHWIHRFPELNQLENQGLRQEIQQQKILHAPKDHHLFREGDACRGYVLLLSGIMRVYKVDSEGREILLYRVQAGQSCMLTTTCLLGLQPYPAQGVTESDVDMILLPANIFDRLLAESSEFRRYAMAHMGKRICEMMMLIEDVAFGRMDQRVARVLLQRQPENVPYITCTHQDLASELGTAREVVSRMLKNFERHGWITLSRGSIALQDRDMLHRLLDEH
ncbi:MAG: Crp/Fnr family transcriptional regulator [Mariprofundaceae bacterium]|nr:Crp/Fnr family transcriptional regulator [Mariprofundaceae bacterium]